MFKKIKYILLLIMCGQIAHSQAFTENAMLDYKRSSAYINNYHGPVKSAFWYYTYVKDAIPSTVTLNRNIQNIARDNFMRHNRKALGSGVFNEFDKQGRMIQHVGMDKDKSYFGKSELNYKTASVYTYDEEDWKDKKKLKIKKRQIYPVNDYEVIIKPSFTVLTETGNNLIYKYTYGIDDKGRIIKETQIDEGANPYMESTYTYDDRDNIKQLHIRAKQKNPIPFHFLDTETGFCPDLHAAYEYDIKDRMTQVTYYGCNDTLAFEKYVYHPEKEYVTERTRFIKSSMRGVEHVTPTMIFYHNENGDIIEKKYVKSYPNQYLGGGHFELPNSIYYKYEYDKYNNWVKCYIYMEGKPEDSEPTAIAQRDLEYYDS
ncbi:MAG: hypothetical protein RSF68_07000 [Myroides sp.]